jgi:selenide, water dikinase
VTDPNALVGFETRDDAAVYALDAERAVVQTADFFTPVVDDPYWFGRIAAANALSDIWAMGARPLFALNLIGWPVKTLPMAQPAEVLRGGAEAARLGGIAILGGHSIDDPEPKYGLAVTGLVHPARILRNVGARPGDRLLLTKPLGSGIASTALKRGLAIGALEERALEVMAALNRDAGEVLAASGAVHALTDVTGFGLLGHAWGMAEGSRVRLRLAAEAVPILEGILALAAQDVVPGGSRANLAWVAPHVRFAGHLPAPLRQALADAQTNGGLLAAVDAEAAGRVLAALQAAGVAAVEVGLVAPLEGGEEPGIDVA